MISDSWPRNSSCGLSDPVHRRALARLSGSGSSNGGSESDSDRDCDSEKVSYGTEEELAESDGK